MASRPGTTTVDYARYLTRARFASALKQLPYRLHVRRLRLGDALDVGCGAGRNLDHVRPRGVGIDHNPFSVAACRDRGLEAYVPDDFARSPLATTGRFDSLLLAHVAEHMPFASACDLLSEYLPFVKDGGRVAIITPQERGFASDATHVEFFDFAKSAALADAAGLRVVRQYSFPFPRALGRGFAYNEFVTIAEKP